MPDTKTVVKLPFHCLDLLQMVFRGKSELAVTKTRFELDMASNQHLNLADGQEQHGGKNRSTNTLKSFRGGAFYNAIERGGKAWEFIDFFHHFAVCSCGELSISTSL